MRNKMIMIGGIFVCILLLSLGIFYFTVLAPSNKVLKDVRNLEIEDVDLNKIADGSYIGEFSYSRTNCRVEVVVSSHRIETIKVLENGGTDYAKKAEAVLDKVVEEQKVDVDVVSGATTTSKALLKAVESALKR